MGLNIWYNDLKLRKKGYPTMSPFQYNVLTGIKANPSSTYSQRKRAVQTARFWVGDRNLTVLGHTRTLASEAVQKVLDGYLQPVDDYAHKILGAVGDSLAMMVAIPCAVAVFAVSFVALLPKGYASATFAQKILKGNIKRKQKGLGV